MISHLPRPQSPVGAQGKIGRRGEAEPARAPRSFPGHPDRPRSARFIALYTQLEKPVKEANISQPGQSEAIDNLIASLC